MTPEELFDHNAKGIKTLDPRVQPSFDAFLRECWKKTWYWRGSYFRRTYEEQLLIYTKNRTKQIIKEDLARGDITRKEYEDLVKLFDQGKNLFDTAIRTYVISGSSHLTGLAIDIIPTGGGSYEDLEALAVPYGIARPLAKPPFGDLAHFQYMSPLSDEPVTKPSPAERMRRLAERLLRAIPEGKARIQEAIDIIKRAIARGNKRK